MFCQILLSLFIIGLSCCSAEQSSENFDSYDSLLFAPENVEHAAAGSEEIPDDRSSEEFDKKSALKPLYYGKKSDPFSMSWGKRIPTMSFGKRVAPFMSFRKRGVPSMSFGKRGAPSLSFGKRGVPSVSFGKRRVPSISFGKRGVPSMSFGKRGVPSLSFGKRAVPSMSFGKRGVPSMSFGKRGVPSMSFGKRVFGMSFGKRNAIPQKKSDSHDSD